MFTKTLFLIGLLAAAPAADAATTAELARETGISERHVRMLLGARTPYAEYRIVYNRKLRQFRQQLGETNYRKLMDGEAIVLRPAEREPAWPIASTGEAGR